MKWTELSTDICRDNRLSRSALRVYIALTSFIESDGIARPRRGELNKLTQLTGKGSIEYAMDELAECGWITRKMDENGGINYYFLYPFVEEE